MLKDTKVLKDIKGVWFMIDKIGFVLNSVRRFSLLAVCGLFLTGCSTALGTSGLLLGAFVGSLILAEKAPHDIVAEKSTGMDCDLFQGLSKKQPTCVEPTNEADIQRKAKPYCYRDIGTVVCYERPNPFLDNAQPVGSNTN